MVAVLPDLDIRGTTDTFQCSVTRADWESLRSKCEDSQKQCVETQEKLQEMVNKVDELVKVCAFLEESLKGKELENDKLKNLNASYLRDIQSLKEASRWSNLLPSCASVVKALGALGVSGAVMMSAYNWQNISKMLMKN